MDDEGKSGLSQERAESRANFCAAEFFCLLAAAIRSDQQVPQVAQVGTLRVAMTVPGIPRIEVRARGLEAGGLALAGGVDVEPVLSRGQPGNSHMYLDSVSALPECHPADVGALGIAEDALDRRRHAAAAACDDSHQTHDYDSTHLEPLHR